MSKAVYAGTFDPITNGHLDICQRAANLFDEIIIAVADDNYKNTLFSTEERCQLVAEATAGMANVRVQAFSGLLVDFCQRVQAPSIIRGLRAVSDFEKEFQMALMNRSLNNQIDTVFLMSGGKHLFVSSSLIKNAAILGGHIEELVPEPVYLALQKKYAKE